MLAPVSVLAAELVVVESTSPNYELAQIITDTDTVVLEQGTEIILISEDGLVIGLVGPFDGPLTPIDSAGGYDALRALGVLVGQAEVDARSIGGVRFGDAQYSEIDPIREFEDGRDTPWMVHVGIGGTQCVPLDVEPIVYWREDDSNDQRLNVRHLASGGSVTIDWQAGERTLAWPQQLPVSHDQVYLLRMDDDLRSVALMIRAVPDAVIENGIATVAWMAAKGCTSQARLALAKL